MVSSSDWISVARACDVNRTKLTQAAFRDSTENRNGEFAAAVVTEGQSLTFWTRNEFGSLLFWYLHLFNRSMKPQCRSCEVQSLNINERSSMQHRWNVASAVTGFTHVYTLRPWPLTFDLRPWKPFHQFPLTWRCGSFYWNPSTGQALRFYQEEIDYSALKNAVNCFTYQSVTLCLHYLLFF